jgi:hypothetical protein
VKFRFFWDGISGRPRDRSGPLNRIAQTHREGLVWEGDLVGAEECGRARPLSLVGYLGIFVSLRARAPAFGPWPSPKIEPIARKVLAESVKLVWRLVRNGSNVAVSVPTTPRHRSWVTLRLNPGSKSLRNELVKRLRGPAGTPRLLGLFEII